MRKPCSLRPLRPLAPAGGTPLLRLNKVVDGAPANVLAKLESLEPCSSGKAWLHGDAYQARCHGAFPWSGAEGATALPAGRQAGKTHGVAGGEVPCRPPSASKPPPRLAHVPGPAVKDRIGLAMIEDAEKAGKITPGKVSPPHPTPP